MTLRIGDAWLYVGDGLEIPKAEAERVLGLAGQAVTAGYNVRHWSDNDWNTVMGDASHLCLATEEEMRPLVTIRARLEQNELWLPDALTMETGVWEHFLASLPTAEGAPITDRVDELLRGDRRALARDILSWFSRTNDIELRPLPSLQLCQWGLVPPCSNHRDARMLATVVVTAALGLRLRTLIREDWQGLDRCRRLWLLVKLLDAVEPQ